MTCPDCTQPFTYERKPKQRGRPPLRCVKCRVLRVLYPRRCAECRKAFVQANCKHWRK